MMKSGPDAYSGAKERDSDLLPVIDDDYIKGQKEKARKLRDSAWWKRKRSSGACHYCRKKFKPAELTMDHVIPISRGGASVKENLVPCCKDCNNQKQNLLPAEWKEFLDSLSQASR